MIAENLRHHDREAEGCQQRGEQIAFDDTRNNQFIDYPADTPHHHEGYRNTE
jgi:hypothetical protein